MAGFNTIVKNFADATCEMHLMSPSGLPVYGIQKADGSMDVALGSWGESGETEVVGTDAVTGKDVLEPILEAKPPKPGDKLECGYVLTKDDKINPSNIALRSMSSADAKKFREDRECTIDPVEMLTFLQGRRLFETTTNDKGEKVKTEKTLPEDQMKVFWASIIGDFVNLPYEDKQGKTVLSAYSEENALDFIELMPGVVFQMKDIVFDPKKYERSTNSG